MGKRYEWDSEIPQDMMEDWKPEDDDTNLSAEDELLVQEIIDCIMR